MRLGRKVPPPNPRDKLENRWNGGMTFTHTLQIHAQINAIRKLGRKVPLLPREGGSFDIIPRRTSTRNEKLLAGYGNPSGFVLIYIIFPLCYCKLLVFHHCELVPLFVIYFRTSKWMKYFLTSDKYWYNEVIYLQQITKYMLFHCPHFLPDWFSLTGVWQFSSVIFWYIDKSCFYK